MAIAGACQCPASPPGSAPAPGVPANGSLPPGPPPQRRRVPAQRGLAAGLHPQRRAWLPTRRPSRLRTFPRNTRTWSRSWTKLLGGAGDPIGQTPSGVEGIVEVLLAGNRIVHMYATSPARHLPNGHLFELDTQKDLTEQKLVGCDPYRSESTAARSSAFGKPKLGIGRRELLSVRGGSGLSVLREVRWSSCPMSPSVTLHIFSVSADIHSPPRYLSTLGVWCSRIGKSVVGQDAERHRPTPGTAL